MNFYKMVSRDLANYLDVGISLRNGNPCYQRFSTIISIMGWVSHSLWYLLNKNGNVVFDESIIKEMHGYQVSFGGWR